MLRKYFLQLPDKNGEWNAIKDFKNQHEVAEQFAIDTYDAGLEGAVDLVVPIDGNEKNGWLVRIPNPEFIDNKSAPQFIEIKQHKTFGLAVDYAHRKYNANPNTGKICVIEETELYEHKAIVIKIIMADYRNSLNISLDNLERSDILDIVTDEIGAFIKEESRRDPTSKLNLIEEIEIDLDATDNYEINEINN